MNSTRVLNKIMALLSISKEVELAYAKLKDGTNVSSPTFDVGEPFEIISEDGTKHVAPDGEYEISLKDTEGNDVIIKLIVKDGTITERENVELETVPVEEIPQADGDLNPANVRPDLKNEVTMADMPGDVAVAEDIITEEEGVDTESEDGVEINIADLAKNFLELAVKCEALGYRISEMEKTMTTMAGEVPAETTTEEPAPKLDGAPVEAAKFSTELSKNYGKRERNSQSSFLSKLYNN
jgi:hypothetical protein